MLNNKGQSLVLFILIIPILLGVMVLVIDVGKVMNIKNHMEHIHSFVLEWELEKDSTDYQEEEIQELLDYNIENGNSQVKIQNGKILLQTTTYVKGILSSIVGFDGFRVVSEYVGYIDDHGKIIDKIR